VVLLIGSVGGLAVGAIAGARRTQSSFPAFLESTNPSDITIEILVSGNNPQLVRAIARLPHVKRVERRGASKAFVLGATGTGLEFPSSVSLDGSVDGLHFDQDRAVAIEG